MNLFMGTCMCGCMSDVSQGFLLIYLFNSNLFIFETEFLNGMGIAD